MVFASLRHDVTSAYWNAPQGRREAVCVPEHLRRPRGGLHHERRRDWPDPAHLQPGHLQCPSPREGLGPIKASLAGFPRTVIIRRDNRRKEAAVRDLKMLVVVAAALYEGTGIE